MESDDDDDDDDDSYRTRRRVGAPLNWVVCVDRESSERN
jgi:hypothetical protein